MRKQDLASMNELDPNILIFLLTGAVNQGARIFEVLIVLYFSQKYYKVGLFSKSFAFLGGSVLNLDQSKFNSFATLHVLSQLEAIY